MKIKFENKTCLFFFASIVFLLAASPAAKAQNSISGVIFDTNRQPVAKIEVELLDEFERLMRSTKTNSSGLYIFQGLRAGNYYIQVRTDGTNFKTVKERVQLGQSNRINSTTGGLSGLENLQINLTLEIDRPGDATQTSNEILFAQNVPKEAQDYFETALKKFGEKKPDEARAALEAALKIFPDYFLALERLGYEHLAAAKFAEAEAVFTKAFQINAKSLSAKSGLGIAQYKLGKKTQAAATLEEALALNANSPNSLLFLGKIYRELKDFEKAETNLKKAKELSRNKLADVHWELALLYYYNLNRPAEAAAELELYLKAKPKAENRAQVEKLIKIMREQAGPKN